MALHAAVAVWLSSWTGVRDVAVGTAIAGRDHPSLDAIVGMFVNTVTLRLDVDPAASFPDLLEAAKRADLDAFGHAAVPFDQVVDAIGFTPFQVMLTYEDVTVPGLHLPGLTVRAQEMPTTQPRFDIEIAVRELVDGAVEARVVYDDARFTRASIVAALSRLATVVEAVVDDPYAPVGDIAFPAHAPAALPAAPVRTMAELFASSSARVSVAGTGESHGLSQAATPLAWHLIDLGLGPEDRVAIVLSRSVAAVRATVAVALAGATFVPVDPGQPAARIVQVLADAGVRFAIADPGTPVPEGVQVIDPATRAGRARPITDADRVRPLRGDHPAYLIYTSGSTGRPKGVVITHRGLASLTRSLRSSFDLDPPARILQVAAPTFDASILEYLLAVVGDATLVVAPADVYGGDVLADILRAEAISHWFCTPAMLAQLGSDDLPALRVLAVGGEAWSPSLALRWAPGRTMINVYGPTETTVLATASRPLGAGEWPSIGTALDGVTAVVLNARLRPVPVGVVGELYLSGPGLARGYLGEPAQTASRFVASPFADGCMYRTGDLVRWVEPASGRGDATEVGGEAALLFVGRTDGQVKMRGVRIELGEIDAVLSEHPAVTTAVTVAHGETLDGYVHGPDRTLLDPVEVRKFVATRLPRHMVPATVTVLDAVPLTLSGKIDRRALPAPSRSSSNPTEGGYRTPAEHLVATVFADLLGAPTVAGTDDFFAMGGNSLLATRLAARIAAAAARPVAVRDVFDHPTVAGLAAAVFEHPAAERTPLIPTADNGRAPLAPAQQRLWLINRFDVAEGRTGDHVAFAVELVPETDLAALADAAADVAERHAVLRTVHPDSPNGPEQRVLANASLDFTVREAPVDLDSALTEFARTGLDLTTDLPLRTRLFRAATGFTLAVVIHHIAIDGLSLLPLRRDLALAYSARQAGRAPVWQPLPVTYRDFARWQRQLIGDSADPHSLAGRQIDHWTRALAGASPLLTLPSDRPRTESGGTAASIAFTVSAELHAAVDKLARANDATGFMVVHAALAVLLLPSPTPRTSRSAPRSRAGPIRCSTM